MLEADIKFNFEILEKIENLVNLLYPQSHASLYEDIRYFRQEVLAITHSIRNKLSNDEFDIDVERIRVIYEKLRSILDERDIEGQLPDQHMQLPGNQFSFYVNCNNKVTDFAQQSSPKVDINFTQINNYTSPPTNTNNIVSIATGTNIKALLASHYQEIMRIQLPGFNVETSLDSSYVNLALVDEEAQRMKEKKVLEIDRSDETLEFFSSRVRSYEDVYQAQNTVPLKDMFNLNKQVIVLGRAGIGKSTFCKFICQKWSTENSPTSQKDEIVSIISSDEADSKNIVSQKLWSEYDAVYWLPLRHLRNYEIAAGKKKTYMKEKDLAKFIYYVLVRESENTKTKIPQGLTEGLILEQLCNEKLKILFLLDGFDECEMFLETKGTQQRTFAGKLFDRFLQEPNYIITSRPYAIRRSKFLSKASFYELLGFTDINIPIYISKTYKFMNKSDEEAFKLIQLLRRNPSIWGTAHVPIHLAFICAVLRPEIFDNYENVTMSVLYRELTQQLGMRFFNFQCNLPDIREPTEINNRLAPIADFLGELALTGFVTDTLLFNNEVISDVMNLHLKKLIASYKDFNLLANDYESDKIRFDLLKPIVKTGYLNAVNQNDNYEKILCYFPHASIQEYYAAKILSKWFKKEITLNLKYNGKNYTSAKKFIKSTIQNSRYEVIYWFMAGALQESRAYLMKYTKIIIDSIFIKGFLNKAKNLFSLNTNLELSGSLLRSDTRMFRQLLLLMRCLEEGNLSDYNEMNYIFETYKALAKDIIQWEDNSNKYYRLFIFYFKLCPHLVQFTKIQDLIKQELSQTNEERIRTRAQFFLSEIKIEDVAETLIKIYKNSPSIQEQCQALESLALVIREGEQLIFRNLLIDCVKNGADLIKITAINLLAAQSYDAALPYMINLILTGNVPIRKTIVKLLWSNGKDVLLKQLYQIEPYLHSVVLNVLAVEYYNEPIVELESEIMENLSIILVGNACGKTAIITRLLEDKYSEIFSPTTFKEPDVSKKILVDQKVCNITITDTGTTNYVYRLEVDELIQANQIVIVCFSIVSKSTFDYAQKLCLYVTRMGKKFILAGLKSDLEKNREVSPVMAFELARSFDTEYIECSAKTGEKVETLFALTVKLAPLLLAGRYKPQQKLFSEKRKNIESILVPSFDLDRTELGNLLTRLQGANLIDPSLAKRYLSKLDERSVIIALFHTLLKNISNQTITFQASSSLAAIEELEKRDARLACIAYVECLASRETGLQKQAATRLKVIGLATHPEIIATHIVVYQELKSIDKELTNVSRKFLLKTDLSLLNTDQIAVLYEICVNEISAKLEHRNSRQEWLYAIDKIKQIKRLNILDISSSAINALRGVDEDVYKGISDLFLNVEGELVIQHSELLVNPYLSCLNHPSSLRRQLALSVLGKIINLADARILDTHIKNLQSPNLDVCQMAAELLQGQFSVLRGTKIEQIYKIYLQHLSGSDIARIELGLRSVKLLGKQNSSPIIDWCIQGINASDGNIYQIACNYLQELELNQEQIDRLCKFYLDNLKHHDEHRRMHAWQGLKHFNRDSDVIVIEANITNLLDKDFGICQMADRALQEQANYLNEKQIDQIHAAYMQNLDHYDLSKRELAWIGLKRLDRGHNTEVILTHIENLKSANLDALVTALQALLELKGHLTLPQIDFICRILTRNLNNVPNHECALNGLEQFGRQNDSEVIIVHLVNLLNANTIISQAAEHALDKIRSVSDMSEIVNRCYNYLNNASEIEPDLKQQILSGLSCYQFLHSSQVLLGAISFLLQISDKKLMQLELILKKAGQLDLPQRRALGAIYVANLDNFEQRRREYALNCLKKIKQQDSAEAIASYIFNLLARDKSIYLLALESMIMFLAENRLNQRQLANLAYIYFLNLKQDVIDNRNLNRYAEWLSAWLWDKQLKPVRNNLILNQSEFDNKHTLKDRMLAQVPTETLIFKVYLEHLEQNSNLALRMDLVLYAQNERAIWFKFNKFDPDTFFRCIADALKSQISPFSMLMTIIAREVNYSQIHTLIIRHLLGASPLINVPFIWYLYRTEYIYLGDLCQIDTDIRKLVRIVLTRSFATSMSRSPVNSYIEQYPFIVGVIGSKQCGKSTLIHSLDKNKLANSSGSKANYKFFSHSHNNYFECSIYQVEDENLFEKYDVLIICFDVTSRDSFQYAINLCGKMPKGQAFFLVALKTDLMDKVVIRLDEVLQLTERYNTTFIECSAEKKFNIEQVVKQLDKAILFYDIPTLTQASPLQEKDIRAILAKKPMSNHVKLLITNALKNLQNDPNSIVSNKAKVILNNLNSSSLAINVRVHLDNIYTCHPLLARISSNRLKKLESQSINEMLAVYRNILLDCEEVMLKAVLSRLFKINCLSKPEVINTCFFKLSIENKFSFTLMSALFKVDIKLFSTSQLEFIFKSCIMALDHNEEKVRNLALAFLGRIGKLDDPQIVTKLEKSKIAGEPEQSKQNTVTDEHTVENFTDKTSSKSPENNNESNNNENKADKKPLQEKYAELITKMTSPIFRDSSYESDFPLNPEYSYMITSKK